MSDCQEKLIQFIDLNDPTLTIDFLNYITWTVSILAGVNQPRSNESLPLAKSKYLYLKKIKVIIFISKIIKRFIDGRFLLKANFFSR